MRACLRWCLLSLMLLVAGGVMADDFLEPEQAFKLAARTAPDGAVVLQFEVAQGYYLYREPLRFTAGERVLVPDLPPGVRKFDETFQKEVETYRDRLAVRLDGIADVQQLMVTAQGCADEGLCYAPATVILSRQADGKWTMAPSAPMAPMLGVASWRDSPQAGQSGPSLAVGVSFKAGLGVWLTPLAWPLAPILVLLLVGTGAARVWASSLSVALAHGAGLTLMAGVMGAWATLMAPPWVARLQAPEAIWGSVSVMTAMALLGLWSLWRPGVVAAQVLALSLSGRGRALGLALLAGVLVALPLFGALPAGEQSAGMGWGGVALFAMACGVVLPLLLVAVPTSRWAVRCRRRVLAVKVFLVASLLIAVLGLLRPLLT